jgi:HAD superfamily hydrolase (TIGR01509 family)
MLDDQLAFIWDMDGTLVDSYPAIVPAAVEALADFGVELRAEALHAEVIRSSVGELLERIAARRRLDPLALKAAFNRLNDSRIDQIRPMPHCAEALAALREQGHLHFVYTHRGASCRTILEQTGLTPFFTEVVTALNGFPRKPAPDGIRYLLDKYALDPGRCFYVGDRSLDVEAAERAGVGSILYLDPASPGKSTGREDRLVRDLLEIPALSEKLLAGEEG